jgi:hypothetical protein
MVSDARVRMSLEFELYFANIMSVAAQSLDMPAVELLQAFEEDFGNKTIPVTSRVLREMCKELFFNGFAKGLEYSEEKD